MDFENTKDAFAWIKENYSSLSEEEYKELTDKWGKLKVYSPIVSDNELLYELNELSFSNEKWIFSPLSTESDENNLNTDYPIIAKEEPAQIDFSDDEDVEFDGNVYTTVIDGSEKDGAVLEEEAELVEDAEEVEVEEEAELVEVSAETEEKDTDSLSDKTKKE